MRIAHACGERLSSVLKLLGEVSSQHGHILPLASMVHGRSDGQHGSESSDVVVPKNPFDLVQVGFVEECPITGRLQIHSANFHVERIFLRSHNQVGANGAEFAIDLVADVGSDRNHGGGNGDAQRNGGSRQEFAPLLSPE